MKKKLLALLMCATMVLGTGVTAFADTASDVKKIYGSNADDFIAEYTTAKEITKTVYNADQQKDFTYGYVATATSANPAGKYAIVGAYKDGDNYVAATYVAKEQEVTNASANLAAAVAATTEAVVLNAKYASGASSLILAKDGVIVKAGVSYTDGGKASATNGGWVKVNAGNLVKADSKLLAPANTTGGTVYANISKATSTDDKLYNTLYDALTNKTLTSKAVLVKVDTMFLQDFASETINVGGKELNVKPLYNSTKLVSGEYTFDSDLITRTGFASAGAVNVFKYTGYDAQYSPVIGGVIPQLNKIATAEVGKTYAFDDTADWTNGYFIFDEGKVESGNTDGVDADTTTAAASNTSSSPKTGDVAPIAALAVVMMGACGAMVVASKKRA